jgi:hypothetical protein
MSGKEDVDFHGDAQFRQNSCQDSPCEQSVSCRVCSCESLASRSTQESYAFRPRTGKPKKSASNASRSLQLDCSIG